MTSRVVDVGREIHQFMSIYKRTTSVALDHSPQKRTWIVNKLLFSLLFHEQNPFLLQSCYNCLPFFRIYECQTDFRHSLTSFVDSIHFLSLARFCRTSSYSMTIQCHLNDQSSVIQTRTLLAYNIGVLHQFEYSDDDDSNNNNNSVVTLSASTSYSHTRTAQCVHIKLIHSFFAQILTKNAFSLKIIISLHFEYL